MAYVRAKTLAPAHRASRFRHPWRHPSAAAAALWALFLAASALGFAACGDMEGMFAADPGMDNEGRAPWDASDASAGADADRGAGEPPPEEADQDEAQRRVASIAAAQRYVYVPNEEAGVVARIDSETLAVLPILTPIRPARLRVAPGAAFALVLGRGEGRIILLKPTPEGADLTEVEVVRGANDALLTPDGRWALVYYNAGIAEVQDPVGSFQEVSLVETATGRSVLLSTGFGLRQAGLASDGRVMWLLTDDGLHVFRPQEQSADGVLPLVPFAGVSAERVPQVALTRDASAALLRFPDATVLRRMDVESATVEEIDLGERLPPMLALGGADEVVIPLPGQQALAFVSFRRRLAVDLRTLGVPVDRVAEDRSRSLLLAWQGSGEVRQWVSIDREADLAMQTYRSRFAVRELRSLGPLAPWLVQHGPQSNMAWTFSLADPDTAYTKLIDAGARPVQIEADAEGEWAFLRLEQTSAASQRLIRVHLHTMAQETLRFPATVEVIGWMPGGERLYASIADPLGRLVFVDPATGSTQTVSGYLLNAFVE